MNHQPNAIISKTRTSWQTVSKWYDKLVGDKGQYYHQHVVIPGVIRLLQLSDSSTLLDIACGQGILARSIAKSVTYAGFDVSEDLIASAKKLDRNPKHTYYHADATKPFPVGEKSFTHAAIILALQNIEFPERVIEQAAAHIEKKGSLVLIVNHPAFRIPRQSSWGIDDASKLQYRRVNRYMSPLKIPITMHPGQKQSALTWSFHNPISFYVDLLGKHGFVVDAMEEWASDKESVGKAAKMENRSRAEIPLFLAIRARRVDIKDL